mgnify:CR=1 FL=1
MKPHPSAAKASQRRGPLGLAVFWGSLALWALLGGCKEAPPDKTSPAPKPKACAEPNDYVWALPQGFPVPKVPEDNPMSQAKVDLGRHLFYDKRLSGNGTFSCASCHLQALAFTDGRAQAKGATGELHPRSSMSLAGVAYAQTLTWANPIFRRLERQALGPLFAEFPVEMGLAGKESEAFERLAKEPLYPPMFKRAFPCDDGQINLKTITRALAAFQRTLISGHSAFDKRRTEPEGFAESARRGHALFESQRLGCATCHGGVTFAEPQAEQHPAFFNTGLYNLGDDGRYPHDNTGVYEISHKPQDMGHFKVPTLRNIALTAPYMHDGSIATLDGVIDHYAAAGRNITEGPHAGNGAQNPHKSPRLKGFTLTAQERTDLLAFLKSLTDPSFLSNPTLSNPWDGPNGVRNHRTRSQ